MKIILSFLSSIRFGIILKISLNLKEISNLNKAIRPKHNFNRLENEIIVNFPVKLDNNKLYTNDQLGIGFLLVSCLKIRMILYYKNIYQKDAITIIGFFNFHSVTAEVTSSDSYDSISTDDEFNATSF
mgnify:CR=1 FL=1